MSFPSSGNEVTPVGQKQTRLTAGIPFRCQPCTLSALQRGSRVTSMTGAGAAGKGRCPQSLGERRQPSGPGRLGEGHELGLDSCQGQERASELPKHQGPVGADSDTGEAGSFVGPTRLRGAACPSGPQGEAPCGPHLQAGPTHTRCLPARSHSQVYRQGPRTPESPKLPPLPFCKGTCQSWCVHVQLGPPLQHHSQEKTGSPAQDGVGREQSPLGGELRALGGGPGGPFPGLPEQAF